MKQLNKWQTALYICGGLLMVIGAGGNLFAWALAPWVYAIGALAFAAMQMAQRYEGTNITLRRLRRIMLLSDVLFLVAALFLFADQNNALHLPWITYINYVYRKWVVILLIAAILQLYSTHRIDGELEREAKKR